MFLDEFLTNPWSIKHIDLSPTHADRLQIIFIYPCSAISSPLYSMHVYSIICIFVLVKILISSSNPFTLIIESDQDHA